MYRSRVSDQFSIRAWSGTCACGTSGRPWSRAPDGRAPGRASSAGSPACWPTRSPRLVPGAARAASTRRPSSFRWSRYSHSREARRATGGPHRSRRLPRVTRKAGLGACSPWARRAGVLRPWSGRRRRSRAKTPRSPRPVATLRRCPTIPPAAGRPGPAAPPRQGSLQQLETVAGRHGDRQQRRRHAAHPSPDRPRRWGSAGASASRLTTWPPSGAGQSRS
jgi:hypothetical protein